MQARLLCTNDEERGRILDMSARLRPVALASSMMLLAGAAVTIPTFGWLGLIPDTAGALAYYLLTRHIGRFARPELALVAMWLAAEVLVGLSFALDRGPREYLLSLLAFPAVFGSIMFPRRMVIPCVAFTLAVTACVGLGWVWQPLSATPPILLVPVVAVLVLSMTGSALGRLDASSRSTAIVDQLTGVFNRMALIPRAAELAHQAAVTGNPVSVIVGDVDSFKSINDQLGHTAGDTVLKELAHRLGACLGPFEPIYRFGGEEFVIMLGGAGLARAVDVAESLRQSVCAEPILGSTVTMSFGVAASNPGEAFDFDEIFTSADRALYAAKRGGRNRVSVGARERSPGSDEKREDQRRAPVGRRAEDRLGGAGGALIQLGRSKPAAPRPWQERIEREHQATGNWLVRDQLERDHMLDLNRLLGRNFRRTAAITFAGIIASVPWFGALMLVPPLLAGAAYNLIQIRLRRLRRPEFALVTGWLLMQLGIAFGFMLSRHAPLFALPLFLLMVIGSAAVFPRRAVVLGVATTAILLVTTAMVLDAAQVRATPGVVIFPLVLLGIVGLTGSAVGRSSIDYRGAAVVDELTGMLNRAALSARAAELVHQSRVTGERVALILADLDHFKSINDGHGHRRGDAVLQEVAYRIRKHLRAFESVYRLGGEEFAVLLAGCGRRDATLAAERLSEAVRSAPIEGLTVTMSCGVAATGHGEQFEFDAVFARADAALYAAKRAGRDCVRADSAPVAALAA